MSDTCGRNGKPLERVHQQMFFGLEQPAPGESDGPTVARKRRSASNAERVSGLDTITMTAMQAVIADMAAKLAETHQLVAELYERVMTGTTVKEYYTTQEVAKLLKKRPYTVREWCRLGRVHGEKSHCGRGLDEEWRISHAELIRIQNEGLLPVVKTKDLPRPHRL